MPHFPTNGVVRGWNIVKIDGKPYHMDLTWDMANSKAGQINYDYFNLPDIAIRKDHSDFAGVPTCDAWDANHFLMNGLYFQDMRQLEAYLMSGIQAGGKQFLFSDRLRGAWYESDHSRSPGFVLAVAQSEWIHAGSSPVVIQNKGSDASHSTLTLKSSLSSVNFRLKSHVIDVIMCLKSLQRGDEDAVP